MKSVGIYNPYLATRGGGEKVCLAMAEYLSKDFQVKMITRESTSLAELGRYFDVDLSKVKIHVLPKKSFFWRFLTTSRLPWPGKLRNILSDYHDRREIKKISVDIFVNNLYGSKIQNPAAAGIYMCMFPFDLQQIKPALSYGFVKRIYLRLMQKLDLWLNKTSVDWLSTYQVVTANSEFTRSWIKKLWHKDSIVLFPICDDMGSVAVGQKENIILNVGRFFGDQKESHHKKQHVLLEAFIAMPELHQKGWSLHFVGSVANDEKSQKYIENLQVEAKGYPVYFHFDADYETLRSLYRQAKIYWHATGFGNDAEARPETQEHFGISSVEAMSAGGVPVVINSGGQRESVEVGKTGFLWDTIKQMQETTMKLATDNNLWQKYSHAAILGSKKFDKAHFHSQLDTIVTTALGKNS